MTRFYTTLVAPCLLGFIALSTANAISLPIATGTDLQLSINARTLTEQINAHDISQTHVYAFNIDGLFYDLNIGPDAVRMRYSPGGGAPGIEIYNFNDESLFGEGFDGSAYHDWVMDLAVGTGAYTVTIDGTHVLNGIAESSVILDQFEFGDGSSNGRFEGELTALSLTTSTETIFDLGFCSLPSAQGFTFGGSPGVIETNVFSVSGCNTLTLDTLGESYSAGAVYVYDLTAAPVPIPTTVWLFSSALVLLGWIRRKNA